MGLNFWNARIENVLDRTHKFYFFYSIVNLWIFVRWTAILERLKMTETASDWPIWTQIYQNRPCKIIVCFIVNILLLAFKYMKNCTEVNFVQADIIVTSFLLSSYSFGTSHTMTQTILLVFSSLSIYRQILVFTCGYWYSLESSQEVYWKSSGSYLFASISPRL